MVEESITEEWIMLWGIKELDERINWTIELKQFGIIIIVNRDVINSEINKKNNARSSINGVMGHFHITTLRELTVWIFEQNLCEQGFSRKQNKRNENNYTRVSHWMN